MNRVAGVAILFLLPFMISSCSFRKLVAGKKPNVYDFKKDSTDTGKQMYSASLPLHTDTSAKNTVVPVPVNSLLDQVAPLWKKRLEYKTFSAKTKMHMEGPDNSVDFTAHIRVRKDSVIWINTSVLGLPYARVLITPDSFFMLNYIQKTVFSIPLSSAAKVLPSKVDFYSLQNLVLGEPLREGIITDAMSVGDTFVLKVEDTGYIQVVSYTKADSNLRDESLRMRRTDGGAEASAEYLGYELMNNRKVSTHRILNLRNGADAYLLEMNFTKIDFDEPLDYPFNIPKNYSVKQ